MKPAETEGPIKPPTERLLWAPPSIRTSEAKAIFFVPQTTPSLCSLSVLVSCLLASHKLEPSVQRKPQLRNHLHKIRLEVDLWKGFSNNEGCGRA